MRFALPRLRAIASAVPLCALVSCGGGESKGAVSLISLDDPGAGTPLYAEAPDLGELKELLMAELAALGIDPVRTSSPAPHGSFVFDLATPGLRHGRAGARACA